MAPSLPTLISGASFSEEDMALTAWPKCTSFIPKSDGVILCEEKKNHSLKTNKKQMS